MAKDNKMFYIEDDIKKIQTKTNLYISNYGEEGAFHLGKEIMQNDIDEVIDPNSDGSQIDITYDMKTDRLTCEDDGRGFPEKDYPLEIFCTKNQSGSKFFRSQGGESSGEFGLGMTVVNALSDEFVLQSYREVEKTCHTLVFRRGEKISDTIEKIGKTGKQHGSIISFIPSKKFLGANASMPYKEVIKWLNQMCFFIRKNIKIRVDIYDGMELKETHKLRPREFKEMLSTIVTDEKFSPECSFSGDTVITETVREQTIDPKTKEIEVAEKDVEKTIHLDVALRYTGESITFYDSYCNYTHTTDGGVHQDTVERCFCNFMQQKTKASMTEQQRTKTPILWDDVRAGLNCVINLSTNASVGFMGNAKTRINNAALVPPLTAIINSKLNEFFNEHPRVLEEYIKIIRLNAKARVESAKVKQAVQKERMTGFKEHELKNYIGCTNTGKKFKEIFLVEGESPASSARSGCDPKTQAFFMFRGVTANPFKHSLHELIGPKGNKEWTDLVNILRCGIGPEFNINKLYFNRINIYTDQDVDGFYISSSMLAFFYKYMPGIIEAGKLYKVFTPLYALDDKEHPFVANKAEMISIFHKRIVKNYKIRFIDLKDQSCDKDDLRDFLSDTYEYSENLLRVTKSLGDISKILIEYIVALMVIAGKVRSDNDYDDIIKTYDDNKFVTFIMSQLQEKFPEIILRENQNFSGVADGHYCLLKVNERLFKKCSELIDVFNEYGFRLAVIEKNREERIMTISEFLDDCQKYMPKIKVRYKGLGELNDDEIFVTSLNINKRVSVQYTMETAKEELRQYEEELIKIAHSPEKEYASKRKGIMDKFKINREDLDN